MISWFSVIISLWKRAWRFLWTNLYPIYQKCFVSSLVKTGPVLLDKIFFKISSIYLSYFVVISTWKKVWPFILLHSNIHCTKFEIGTVVLEKKMFNLIVFLLLSHYLPLGKVVWRNLNFIHLKMLFSKCGWNWPSGFWDLYFRYYVIISP